MCKCLTTSSHEHSRVTRVDFCCTVGRCRLKALDSGSLKINWFKILGSGNLKKKGKYRANVKRWRLFYSLFFSVIVSKYHFNNAFLQHYFLLLLMSFIFVKHFELPGVERFYIKKLALPPLEGLSQNSVSSRTTNTELRNTNWIHESLIERYIPVL